MIRPLIRTAIVASAVRFARNRLKGVSLQQGRPRSAWQQMHDEQRRRLAERGKRK